MNGLALLGLFLILYGIFCVVLALTKKPDAIWNMGKIQGFIKVLSEKGAIIFFIIWGLASVGVGIWLLVR